MTEKQRLKVLLENLVMYIERTKTRRKNRSISMSRSDFSQGWDAAEDCWIEELEEMMEKIK